MRVRSSAIAGMLQKYAPSFHTVCGRFLSSCAQKLDWKCEKRRAKGQPSDVPRCCPCASHLNHLFRFLPPSFRPSFFLPSVKGESASSVYESLIGSMEARWEANPLERERIYAPRRGANGAGKGFSSLLKVDYEQRWSFKFRFLYFAFKVVPDKPVLGRVDRFG